MTDEVDYYRLFFKALVITLAVEITALFLVVRLWFKLPHQQCSNPLLLFAGVFASAGTLPWLWFVLPQVLHTYILFVLVGELLVWAAEALFYRCVLRTGWKQSGLLSLACNLASFAVGLLRD